MTLIVTGSLTPDVTGIYVEDAVYNGKLSYYKAGMTAYYIWWSPGNDWTISQSPIGSLPNCFFRVDVNVVGIYAGNGGSYIGTATVTAMYEEIGRASCRERV